jgi:hypothetical protein
MTLVSGMFLASLFSPPVAIVRKECISMGGNVVYFRQTKTVCLVQQ